MSIDLGFYYMANAAGRLVGTLLGGFLYYYTVSGVKTAAFDAAICRVRSVCEVLVVTEEVRG